ncbi:MAG: hypothetical protein ACRCR9_04730 [Chitinophagaceae bacterium]
MEELLQKITEETGVTQEQALKAMRIVEKHVKSKYPMMAPMIKKAFSKIEEMEKKEC